MSVSPYPPINIDDPTQRHAAATLGANTLGSAPGGQVTPDQWNEYVQTIQAAYAASSGFERTKLAAQLSDAQKGRANAYKLAQLQANTSRYGVDVQSQTAKMQNDTELKRLAENARQFEANHALDMQKFGLEFANTYAQYASTPDKFFQAADFQDAAGRAVNGQPAGAYGSVGSPTPKTPADFAVLAGYPSPSATAGGGQPSAAAAAAQGAYSGGSTASAGGGRSAAPDGRVQALGSLFKALPPSNELGMNDRDYAVLQAAHAIIQAPGDLQAGALNQWRPDQKKILTSAIQREGGSAPDWWAQYQRIQPSQGSATAA